MTKVVRAASFGHLADSFKLAFTNESEMSDFKAIQAIYLDWVAGDYGTFPGTSDSLYLEEMAISDYSVGAYTRSMLSPSFGRVFDDLPEFDEDYFHDPLWDEPEPQPLISGVSDEIHIHKNKDFMKLFPNPSDGIIQFKILDDIENPYTLSIMDAQGYVLRQQEFTGAWILDCHDCPAGWYFYRIIGVDGSMQTGKFIIVK